jgi:hypothetical protein
LSCWPPKGATSTSPSWAPGIKNLGSFFIRHSYPNVTDNGAGRGYALFADIPKMSVRGRGKAAGLRVAGGFAVCRPRPAYIRPRLVHYERHRFPPPWSVEDVGADVQRAAFVVKDSGGQQLAYVYFEDEPGRRSKLLTCGEHSEAAGAIAKVRAGLEFIIQPN